jgi:hypothetical protein
MGKLLAIVLVIGITWMAYKKRNHFNDDGSNDVPGIDPQITFHKCLRKVQPLPGPFLVQLTQCTRAS